NKFALVRQLCRALGVHERELAALAAMRGYAYAMHGAEAGAGDEQPAREASRNYGGRDPYAVLRVTREADGREIKRAYRKLISQHHPDKLGDVPAELKRRAEERAREINAAYERIQAERGFR